MSFLMSVAVFINDELFEVYECVTNIEHKGCFVRLFLSNGDVRCFSSDDGCTMKIRFNEYDYPF